MYLRIREKPKRNRRPGGPLPGRGLPAATGGAFHFISEAEGGEELPTEHQSALSPFATHYSFIKQNIGIKLYKICIL